MSESSASRLRQLWNAPFLNWWIVCLLSAALYPTSFAISVNWYVLSNVKILWLLAVVGIAVPLTAYLVVRLIGGLLTLGGAVATWRAYIQPVLVALLCSALLFLLFGAALQELLPPAAVRIGFFVVFASLMAVLFVKGRQRYFSAILLVLITVSGLTWIASFASYKVASVAAADTWGATFPRGKSRFDERPNIYFFIYDAYSSDEAYRRIHGFDNAEQYRKLEDQGFKVVHTFSNYCATWPTTLAFFLGKHHYYDLESGVDDSKFGRSIMAGLAPNPTLDLLRANGYRVQFIHHDDYFLIDRGVIDFVYPDMPAYGALAVFGGELLGKLIGTDNLYAQKSQNREQLDMLLARMPPAEEGPWFTFSHVNLPAHSPIARSWRELGDFSQTFKEKTRAANEHMDKVVAAIKQNDPTAIVIFLGDHGGWRYRHLWREAEDPNAAMASANIDPEAVTLDLFGILIAVYSNGRCDDEIYDGITPVNVMRAVFSCLLDDPSLLDRREADIALIRIKPKIWLTARDRSPLPKWRLLEDR